MRVNALRVIVLIALLSPGGCEERGSTSDTAAGTAPTTTTATPRPTTRAGAVDLLDAPGTRPVTRPADLDPFPTTSTLAPDDPFSTPAGAMTQLMELMAKEDVDGIRAVAADPPPAEQLRQEVSAVAERMRSGAKWEIVDTHARDNAAAVVFRTTYADGKEELAPLLFLRRYDRWKPVLGQPNLRRWTSGEKESTSKVFEWSVKRITDLRGGPATAPTTATTTPAPSAVSRKPQ